MACRVDSGPKNSFRCRPQRLVCEIFTIFTSFATLKIRCRRTDVNHWVFFLMTPPVTLANAGCRERAQGVRERVQGVVSVRQQGVVSVLAQRCRECVQGVVSVRRVS